MTSFYYYDQNPSGFCFLVEIRAFVFENALGIPNQNMKGKNEKDSGLSSKMTRSSKWPIAGIYTKVYNLNRPAQSLGLCSAVLPANSELNVGNVLHSGRESVGKCRTKTQEETGCLLVQAVRIIFWLPCRISLCCKSSASDLLSYVLILLYPAYQALES